MFLAFYHFHLGNYFSGGNISNWPHNPLSRDPNNLEIGFNTIMEDILEIMSNGKLKGISMLDFVGYGSVLMRLEKQAKKIPTWPTEINFSIHKKSFGKRREMFTEYKEQLTRWER